jgi:hypothetical protein
MDEAGAFATIGTPDGFVTVGAFVDDSFDANMFGDWLNSVAGKIGAVTATVFISVCGRD